MTRMARLIMATTSFHIIIPARYGSSRLPGKPLAKIGGQPMVRHVVECAKRSAATSVVVATDDERIARAVSERPDGCISVMTSLDHASGTDRIAEAVDHLGFAEHEIIVNVQGDEPDMPPALINQVAELLAHQKAEHGAVMATATAPLETLAQLHDRSVVKVVTDRDGYALYFSRAAIGRRHREEALPDAASVRRHIGIYACRCGYLKRFAERPPCALEKHEQLEQLRVLWYGEKIACAEAAEIPAPGIDTPADLARIRRAIGRER